MKYFLTVMLASFCIAAFSQADPYPNAPVNGAATTARPMLIISSSSPLFKSFQVEFDTASTFSSKLHLRSSWSASLSYLITSDSMLFNRTYYWRCRSVKLTGTKYDTTAWSITAVFATSLRPTYYGSSRTFAFTDNSGSISLSNQHNIRRVYETDTSRTFTSPLFHRDTTLYAPLWIDKLRFGSRYYIRYREITRLGSSLYSDTATINTGTSGAIITYPSQGFNAYPPSFFIKINANDSLKLFQVEIDTVSTFNSAAHASFTFNRYANGSLSFSGPDLHLRKKYYIRVRAITPVDSSAWTTVNVTTAELPFLSAPVNTTGNISSNVSIQLYNPNRTWLQVQLDSNASFNSGYRRTQTSYDGDSSDIYQNTLTRSFDGLRFGRTYYYRARFFNSLDTSAWTAAWSFTVIDPYAYFSSPSNNATGISVNTQFSWNSIKGVSGYHIQLSKDTFRTINQERFVIGEDSFFTYIATLPYTWYDARIRLFSSGDSTPWRDIIRFRTQLPAVPRIGPMDSAGVTGDSVLLQWRSTGPQYRYELGIWSDKDFVGRLLTQSTSDTFYYFHPQVRGKIYFWDVKSVDGRVSDPSWIIGRDWAFVLLLSPPSLTAPANGAINQQINDLVCSWNGVPGASGYSMELSTSSSFINPTISNVSATSEVLNNLSSGTTFYWRVRAYNDFLGSYSAVFSFRTGSATGIEDVSAANRCSVFPNPFSDRLTIRIPAALQGGGASISLYNLQGQLLRSMPLTGSECELSTESLMEGIYLYRISSEESIQTVKLVKTK